MVLTCGWLLVRRFRLAARGYPCTNTANRRGRKRARMTPQPHSWLRTSAETLPRGGTDTRCHEYLKAGNGRPGRGGQGSRLEPDPDDHRRGRYRQRGRGRNRGDDPARVHAHYRHVLFRVRIVARLVRRRPGELRFEFVRLRLVKQLELGQPQHSVVGPVAELRFRPRHVRRNLMQAVAAQRSTEGRRGRPGRPGRPASRSEPAQINLSGSVAPGRRRSMT
jgi:hypothetical protein